jgi:hypothetical protein
VGFEVAIYPRAVPDAERRRIFELERASLADRAFKGTDSYGFKSYRILQETRTLSML